MNPETVAIDLHFYTISNKYELKNKLKTVDKAAANANYSEFRSLKKEETFNASGQLLHELYFEMFGGEDDRRTDDRQDI